MVAPPLFCLGDLTVYCNPCMVQNANRQGFGLLDPTESPTHMANFAEMNQVYQKRFSAPYPARTTVAVAELPLNALVEIELIAACIL